MRILLADDESKVRFALRVLLEQQPDLEVVGEAADAEDLLMKVTAACPNLVLLDWELPGMPPAILLLEVRRCCPDLDVIVLSGRPEARQAAQAGGASAFVSKADPPERLMAAITKRRSAAAVKS